MLLDKIKERFINYLRQGLDEMDGIINLQFIFNLRVAVPAADPGIYTNNSNHSSSSIRRRPRSITRSEKPLATGNKKHNRNASVLAVLIDWRLFAGALLDSLGAESATARLVLRQPWC